MGKEAESRSNREMHPNFYNQAELLAFCLMPNHFHLLLTPTGIRLERALQFIKGGFSYRVKKELGLNIAVWERGYVDHRIRDGNDYRRHVEYVRQNPVQAGIAVQPQDYAYSSACNRFQLDLCPQGLKPHLVSSD